MVLMVAVMGIHLGQGGGRCRQRAEQGQREKGESHRTSWDRLEQLPCTLHQGESQVAGQHPVGLLPRELEKIGAVASRSGLTVKTIRFYCDEGLIQPSSRSEGGYRLFDEGVFAELALIRTLRAMEISLPDVRQILEARRSGICTCSDLKAQIRSKAGGDPNSMGSLERMGAAQIQAMQMMGSTPTRDNRVTWFLEGMIAHHGGALVMAHDALKKSSNPTIQRLARQIIVAQRREILELRRMLRHDGLDKPEYYQFDALFSF